MAITPLSTSVRASAPVSSFWVALGKARSTGTTHGFVFAWKVALL
jgi:hypothetical protein